MNRCLTTLLSGSGGPEGRLKTGLSHSRPTFLKIAAFNTGNSTDSTLEDRCASETE